MNTESGSGVMKMEGRRDGSLRTALGMALGMAVGTVLTAKVWRATRAIEFAGMTVVIFGGFARSWPRHGAGTRGRRCPRIVLLARNEEELERAEAEPRGPRNRSDDNSV